MEIIETFYILLLQTLITGWSVGHLSVHPSDMRAFNGSVARFDCLTTSEHGVEWMFYPAPDYSVQLEIYFSKAVRPNFRERHRVESCQTRDGWNFSLTINPVKFEDAGRYTCIKVEKNSIKASVDLNVMQGLRFEVTTETEIQSSGHNFQTTTTSEYGPVTNPVPGHGNSSAQSLQGVPSVSRVTIVSVVMAVVLIMLVMASLITFFCVRRHAQKKTTPTTTNIIDNYTYVQHSEINPRVSRLLSEDSSTSSVETPVYQDTTVVYENTTTLEPTGDYTQLRQNNYLELIL